MCLEKRTLILQVSSVYLKWEFLLVGADVSQILKRHGCVERVAGLGVWNRGGGTDRLVT